MCKNYCLPDFIKKQVVLQRGFLVKFLRYFSLVFPIHHRHLLRFSLKSNHLNMPSMNKSTNALILTIIICASAGVLKWLKLLVWVVVVCILLALSKFSLVPWETDLAFYGKKSKKRQYYDSKCCHHPVSERRRVQSTFEMIFLPFTLFFLNFWEQFIKKPQQSSSSAA